MFGLGVLLALSPGSPPGIETLLFGDILGPSDADLISAAALAVLVARPGAPARAAAGDRLRPRRGARRSGSRRRSPTRPCWSCSRRRSVVAVQGLGNLLVVAVFVGPAAAARNLTDRIVPMIAVAVAIAVLAGLAGLYLSYYAGTAGGASVALAIVAAYLLSLPWRGPPPESSTRAGRGLRSTEMPTATDTGWAEHALAALQAAGHRRGGARTAVVEALARHDCAVTALELDDELRRRRRGRPGERLPGARAARAAGPGPAARGLPRHRRLRAGRARRPPSPPRDLPRLRPHGPLRGLLAGAGDRPSSPRASTSTSPSTTSSSAGAASAAAQLLSSVSAAGGCQL